MANSDNEAVRVYELMEKLLHPERYAERMKIQAEMAKGFLNRSDADAIRSDWQAVGDDLRWAIRKYEDER